MTRRGVAEVARVRIEAEAHGGGHGTLRHEPEHAAQHLRRRGMVVGVGVERAPHLSHQRGGDDAAARDVADDRVHEAVVPRDDVVPVAADLDALARRAIATGDVESRDDWQSSRAACCAAGAARCRARARGGAAACAPRAARAGPTHATSAIRISASPPINARSRISARRADANTDEAERSMASVQPASGDAAQTTTRPGRPSRPRPSEIDPESVAFSRPTSAALAGRPSPVTISLPARSRITSPL